MFNERVSTFQIFLSWGPSRNNIKFDHLHFQYIYMFFLSVLSLLYRPWDWMAVIFYMFISWVGTTYFWILHIQNGIQNGQVTFQTAHVWPAVMSFQSQSFHMYHCYDHPWHYVTSAHLHIQDYKTLAHLHIQDGFQMAVLLVRVILRPQC